MKLLQQKDEPLFPDLLWSRPENKRQAGKLLIIGGQAGQFTHVSASFQAAEAAGAGHIRVLLPESLQKFTQHLPNIEYAPSNQSGSFSKLSLSIINEMSEWADHVLLAGDLGKNSETTTVLDGYLLRCITPSTITGNSLASISLPLPQMIKRDVVLALDWPTLQKRAAELELRTTFLSTYSIEKVGENLANITDKSNASLVIANGKNIWCASRGKVSLTKKTANIDLVQLATFCSVWAMQQPDKAFEALTTGCYEYFRT